MSDMDEFELDLLLDAIDRLDPLLNPVESMDWDEMLSEQIRNEHGNRVPGCYHVRPSHTYD